jgi:hypothetical protein
MEELDEFERPVWSYPIFGVKHKHQWIAREGGGDVQMWICKAIIAGMGGMTTMCSDTCFTEPISRQGRPSGLTDAQTRIEEALDRLQSEARGCFRGSAQGQLIEALGCILTGRKGSWWPEG